MGRANRRFSARPIIMMQRYLQPAAGARAAGLNAGFDTDVDKTGRG
jgi:hypothetical protein